MEPMHSITSWRKGRVIGRELVTALAALLVTGCGNSSCKKEGAWLAGTSGALASSTDSVTFAGHEAPTTGDLHGLTCVGDLFAWAVGDRGMVLTTVDGGAHWRAQPTGHTADLRAARFQSASNGVAVGQDGTILRTEDGGARWTRSQAPVAPTLLALAADGAVAVAVGEGGTILRSNDAGRSFSLSAAPAVGALRAVVVAGNGMAFAVGDEGVVLRSRDAGLNWSEAGRFGGALHGAWLAPDGRRLVVVGSGGTIITSQDGERFVAVDSETSATLRAVTFSHHDQDVGWAVGDEGTILVSLDGGAGFNPVASPTRGSFLAVESF